MKNESYGDDLVSTGNDGRENGMPGSPDVPQLSGNGINANNDYAMAA